MGDMGWRFGMQTLIPLQIDPALEKAQALVRERQRKRQLLEHANDVGDDELLGLGVDFLGEVAWVAKGPWGPCSIIQPPASKSRANYRRCWQCIIITTIILYSWKQCAHYDHHGHHIIMTYHDISWRSLLSYTRFVVISAEYGRILHSSWPLGSPLGHPTVAIQWLSLSLSLFGKPKMMQNL